MLSHTDVKIMSKSNQSWSIPALGMCQPTEEKKKKNPTADSSDFDCDGDAYSSIGTPNRGGVQFSSAYFVTVMMHTGSVVTKLLNPERNAVSFLWTRDHRDIVHNLMKESLPKFDELDTCEKGHITDLVVITLIKRTTNVMYSNYCKQWSEFSQKRGNRKLFLQSKMLVHHLW